MDLYNSLCSVTYIHPKNKHDFGELTFQEVLSGDQTVVVLAEAWCSIQQEVGAFILINAEENLRVFKVPWVEHGLRSVGQKLAIHNRHKWKSEQSGPWQNLHGLQTHMGLWNNATLNTRSATFYSRTKLLLLCDFYILVLGLQRFVNMTSSIIKIWQRGDLKKCGSM